MRIQPNYPKVADSDKYYLQLAAELDSALETAKLDIYLTSDDKRAIVLTAIGYFQDVVSDCGIWRSFISIHKSFYGKPLPFYNLPEEYCESELNKEDLQFLVWYVIECNSTNQGMLSPHNADIEKIANLFFGILDKNYLDAPLPTEYTMAMDVELDNIGQTQDILDLSSWLFWNSYLMPHAARPAIDEAMVEAQQIMQRYTDRNEASPHLSDLNDRVMLSNPTGPLALTVGEWLKMIVDGVMPDNSDTHSAQHTHKFYTQLIHATNGSPIAFFSSYDSLESFLSEEMGWGVSPEGHLPNLRNYENFVIFGTPDKGILVAHDVAQYICHPNNPCYDKRQAEQTGYRLLTQRGICPIDLIKYIFSNGFVPHIRMPYESNSNIIQENWDFLARLYQQRFYRPD